MASLLGIITLILMVASIIGINLLNGLILLTTAVFSIATLTIYCMMPNKTLIQKELMILFTIITLITVSAVIFPLI